MNGENRLYLSAEDLRHPLLEQLSDMAAGFARTRFLVVFPRKNGWGQVLLGKEPEKPEFCRLVQSSEDGAKHCRMCHILMSIAAATEGISEQYCHAGASILTASVPGVGRDRLAILSTCVFARSDHGEAGKHDSMQAGKLGLDSNELKEAYDLLPDLSNAEARLARAIMAVAGEAVREITTRALLDAELQRLQEDSKSEPTVQTVIENELRRAASVAFRKKETTRRGSKLRAPAIIEIVSALVSSRPNMPFTVTDIAVAARITPNHFSTLFHHHKGQSFSKFLTEKRMSAAKELLGDLTLNIGEVAAASGYDDPGYFARVFKKETRMSPREWRESLGFG